MTDLNDIANLVSDVAELRGWGHASITINDAGLAYITPPFPLQAIIVTDLAHLQRLAAGIPEPSNTWRARWRSKR